MACVEMAGLHLAGAPLAARECPICGRGNCERVFFSASLPINTTRVIRTRAEALAEPRGDLDLTLCPGCGFLFNPAFDAALVPFDTEQEQNQGFSPTFVRWQAGLATDLAERHRLAGKRIVEVGCGRGEFLGLFCATADATGLGFDPSYEPGRVEQGAERIEVRPIPFTEIEATRTRADLIVCSMTLEHIDRPVDFLGLLRHAAEASGNCPVLVMVPNALHLLRHRHFWDFYYEHCSNFTPGTLARLFRLAGFVVTRLERQYDDQYILIEAVPGRMVQRPLEGEETPATVAGEVRAFAGEVPERLAKLESRLAGWKRAGRRVVMWGSGSRATALANLAGMGEEVAGFVDINPHRQGAYVAGTGHAVLAPAALVDLKPDLVVVLNPMYRAEVGQMVARLGLAPSVETL